MIRAALILLLWLMPLGAYGQMVELRSGEHADFSRLVMQFDGTPDWAFGRTDGGYELRVNQGGLGFDTRRVFDLIPRSRIIAVENPQPGILTIRVAPGHHADAFEIRDGRLVIDIKDGPPPATAQFESPLPAAGAMPDPPATPPIELPLLPPVLPDIPAAVPLVLNAAPPPAPSEHIADMQAEVLGQLARAASQGLIDVDLAETERAIAPEPEPPTPPPPPVAPPKMDLSHVRVQTRVDLDRRSAASDPALTAEGDTCLPDTLFDIAAWGSGAGPGGLVGEFDTPDPARLGDLVRAYLYQGFGAEAKNAMAAFGVVVENADLLHAMADIMDHGHSQTQGRLAMQASCNTSAALWAVLAQPRLGRGDPINRDAVLTAFSNLPIHLRRNLGPGLSERFLAIDDHQTAIAIRNAIYRAPGAHGDGVSMLDARLDLALGDEDAAVETLSDLANDGGIHAAEALVILIDTLVDTAQPVPNNRIAEAEALVVPHRNTPLGAELTRAAISGMIANGQGAGAIDRLRAAMAKESITPEVHAALLGRAYIALAQNADDVSFLQIAFTPQARAELHGASVAARRAVAARLLDLGFADAVRDLLNTAEIPQAEDRILLARAALAQGKPAIAIGYLAGLDDDAARQLRAAAFAMSATSAESPMQSSEPVQSSAQVGSIAHGRNVISQSEAARAAFDALLESLPADSNGL